MPSSLVRAGLGRAPPGVACTSFAGLSAVPISLCGDLLYSMRLAQGQLARPHSSQLGHLRTWVPTSPRSTASCLTAPCLLPSDPSAAGSLCPATRAEGPRPGMANTGSGGTHSPYSEVSVLIPLSCCSAAPPEQHPHLSSSVALQGRARSPCTGHTHPAWNTAHE